MRMAAGSAVIVCSGLFVRSQYSATGLKQSFTEISCDEVDSSCCNTGSTWRDTKISPGKSSTGSRFMVAPAAAVSMLVAPGPIEDVHANVDKRFFIFA